MPGVRELWIFDHAPIMGGGQVFALKLARAAGERARLVCPPQSELARRAADAGVAVSAGEFPALTPGASLVRGVMATRRLLASADPDVIVVANDPRTQAYVWAAARLLRRRPAVVLLVHEQDSAQRASARFVYRRFGALVTIGANTAATYARALPGVEVRQVNNFLLDRPEAVSLADPGPAVGVLARMIPEKGIRELVDELAAHPEAWSTLRVGAAPEDANYVAAVEARIRAHSLEGRVELLGHVENIAEFLAKSGVLVVPSVGNEAQPTVILEALAHTRPVVVRSPLWSTDFERLPVAPYRDADDLAKVLAASWGQPVPHWPELEGRFDPQQAIEGIESAAQSASARS